MTIAIKRDNGEVLWLDGVLSFSEDYRASVTKHPIESGSNIADHIVEDNPSFSVEGVVSAVEWNNGPTYGSSLDIIDGEDGDVPDNTISILGALSLSNLPVNSGFVSIKAQNTNPLISMLPDSIRQYLQQDDVVPVVTMGLATSVDTAQDIKSFIINMNRGFLNTVDGKSVRKKESFTIYELDSNYNFVNSYLDCVCTGVSFREDSQTGDAIFPVMSFEQVKWVSVVETELPENVSSALKAKAADKEDKGKQEPKAQGSTTETDPASETPSGTITKDSTSMAVEFGDKVKKFVIGAMEN